MKRPKFTPQEYETLTDALDAVKEVRENGRSFMERRGAHTILPGADYHSALLSKLAANSDFGGPE